MADPTADERKQYAKSGWAMPDGSFYIRPDNPEDLTNAIHAVGRAVNAGGSALGNVVRKHIIKRAADLKRSDEIPPTWNSDGTLKHVEDAFDFLSHHGVKGMKWGERHDRGHEGEQAKTKTIEKADANFEKSPSKIGTLIAIHNRAAELANDHDVDRINNDPKYKGQDFNQDSPLRREYYKAQQDAFLDRVKQAADEMGTNASGTRKYSIDIDADGNWWVGTGDVHHADMPSPTGYAVKVHYDKTGHIVKIGDPVTVAHADVDEFLEHFGVKGMKWGVSHQRELEMHTRVANGTGSKLDIARATARMTPIDIARHKGSVKSFSTERARKLSAMKDRVNSGHATKLDQLSLLNAYTAEDAARSVLKKPRAEHSAFDETEEFLEHFGVKGMKWGERKEKPAPAPASPEAARAEAIKVKAQTKGTHALSNKELQDLVTRMNLEQQYGKLDTGKGSKVDSGRKFVKQTTDDGRAGINAYKTGKEIAKILGPIVLTVAAGAAANKAAGSPVKYYHPSSRKAITAG